MSFLRSLEVACNDEDGFSFVYLVTVKNDLFWIFVAIEIRENLTSTVIMVQKTVLRFNI